MREKDKELILLFILRTSMYTGEETKDRIVPFLNGYEIGTENQCFFTLQLRKCLEDRYYYEYRALGWPYQVDQFAKKRGLSWVSGFKRVSLELIYESNTSEFEQKFNDHIRKWIENRIGNIKLHFGRGWVDNWIGICDVRQNWFRKIWAKEELQLLIQLNKEIGSIIKQAKEQIKPTNKLLGLAEKFSENIK
jgi:hypothetical protein